MVADRPFRTPFHALTRRLHHKDMERALVPLATAHGELPDFHALDAITFQKLCRDLYQVEPNISTADVFGVSGQSQLGIDIQALHRNDDGISVGQCKCIVPRDLTVKLIREASDEFLKHLDYWRERGVRRFILFVSPDASRKEINEEHLSQRAAFRQLGLEYELWGQAMIVRKLKPHPGIVRTYLRDPWTELLCGGGVSGFPRDVVLIDRVLHEQVGVLARHVSSDAAAEVERLRTLWREGKRSAAVEGIAHLREPGRWQAFPSELRATIVRFEGQLALESEDLPRARAIADEADTLVPGAARRLRSLIARRESGPGAALALLLDDSDIDTLPLKAGLLLETGRITDALALLESVSGTAEVHRLRALAHVCGRELVQARLEIDKAFELAPTWVSVLYSKAIVYYLSAVSPAALPSGLPQWPEPEPWEFVKTDDASRAFLERAADAIAQLDLNGDGPDERRVYESWRLAALANHFERREEAVAYCRELLDRDPGHCQAIVWAVARRLDANLSRSVTALEARVAAAAASVPEIVALVLLRVHTGDHGAALELLANTRQRFVDSDAESLWTLWHAQVSASAGILPPAVAGGTADLPQAQLVRLRSEVAAAGSVDGLIAELQSRHNAADGQASFELCRLLGSHGRWEEAASVARSLMASVGTAEAISLAAATLYNAADPSGTLDVLEGHRGVFPRGELPSDMRRLRLLAQRRLGMLPSAAAEAEDLFRRQPSRAHFLLLADVYFQMGDMRALAVFARHHEQFADLGTVELLQLAMRIAVEDRGLAAGLWRRAASIGFPDNEVVAAVEVGYRLGLDRDLRTLLQRMMQLAGTPGTGVQRYGLDEIKGLLLAHRNDAERIYGLYRSGRLPIHLLAQYLKRPVSWWYRRALLTNQQMGHSEAGPTFTRSGWRAGASMKFESNARLRLHADTTALMIAQHFGVLAAIESAFAPILLPHSTPIALAHMRDATLPQQPARRDALRSVRECVARGAVKLVQDSRGGGFADEHLLAVATTNAWLLVDFLPLSDANGAPLALAPEAEGRVRTGHCVVEALKVLGELSEEDAVRACDALGPEHSRASNRDVPRSADVLCTAGVLECLAEGGALHAAARAFSLHMLRDDFDTFVTQAVNTFDVAEADAAWLKALIDRINGGLQKGTYQLLPQVDHDGRLGESAEDAPSFGCLLDLLRLAPREGDVIWVDDRWATRYVHKDGAPILDTYDVLHILRERGAVPDDRLASFMHDFRDADLRFIALSTEELRRRTRQALDQSGTFHESRELRTIRRQYARSLVSGEDLVIAEDGVGPLEWPYVLESGRAVVDTIVEVWGENEPNEVSRQRAEWILRNLYTADRGRRFTSAAAEASVDHHLEATGLVALLSHPIRIASTDKSAQDKRRAYLEWIYGRLIRRRMEADAKLATTVADMLKAVLLGALEPSPRRAHARIAKLLVRQLVADLPDDLSARLADDPAFLNALDVRGTRQFRIGPHYVNADSFWRAAAEIVRTGVEDTFNANGHELLLKLDGQGAGRHLIVQDTPARQQYLLLTDELDILGDSVAAREATLRRLAPLFDLGQADADAEIARLASLDGPAERVMEEARLRSASAESHYRELERKVSGHEQVDASDFLLEDVEALTRHLRLNRVGGGFGDRLDEASAALLSEVGLRDTIVRLAGVPRPLPERIHVAVGALSSAERRTLLGDLSRLLGSSPIASAHVAHLCGRAMTERASYGRHVRRWARRSVLSALETRPQAWREVLRVCANELAHVEAFRQLPADVRLCVVWTHGDRIFRILVNANANEEWIRDKFGGWSDRLPAEIAFADTAYLAEACHPKQVDLLPFSLDAAAYALGAHEADDALRSELSNWIEGEPARLLALLQQAGLRPDSLDSILAPSTAPPRLGLLTTDLADRVKPTTLMSQVEAALAEIPTGDLKQAWVVLRAVINDQVLPDDLIDRVRTALSSLDLVAVCRNDAHVATTAAVFAAQHASRLGANSVDLVRAQLVELARELGRAPVPDEHALQVLLSCPFYLFGEADSDEAISRFKRVADLLEEIIHVWPASRDRVQYLLDRLVEGLPNDHARLLWGLQVKLRALR